MLIIRIAEVPPATLTGLERAKVGWNLGDRGTLEGPWKRIEMGVRVGASGGSAGG